VKELESQSESETLCTDPTAMVSGTTLFLTRRFEGHAVTSITLNITDGSPVQVTLHQLHRAG
jgi:hypothetical protein